MKKFWQLSDSIRKGNARIMGIPEGEKREKRAESLCKEIKSENFSNLGKEMNIQVHGTKRTSNYLKAKRSSPRHIILKLSKVSDKERILNAAKEKRMVIYRRTSIRLSADFFSRNSTGQERVEWHTQSIESIER